MALNIRSLQSGKIYNIGNNQQQNINQGNNQKYCNSFCFKIDKTGEK